MEIFLPHIIPPQHSQHSSQVRLFLQVHVVLLLGTSEMVTVLCVGSYESGVERENLLPGPAGHLLVMDPRIWVTFWVASAHNQLRSSCSSTSTPTPKSSSTALL